MDQIKKDSQEISEDRIKGLIELKQLDEAEILINRMLSHSPQDPTWLKNKGVIHAKKKEYEAAEECFLAALKKSPEDLTVIVNLGNIYLETGHTDQAESYYKQAMSKEPSYETPYYNLSALYKKKRQHGLSKKFMEEYQRRAIEKRINEKPDPGGSKISYPPRKIMIMAAIVIGIVLMILIGVGNNG